MNRIAVNENREHTCPVGESNCRLIDRLLETEQKVSDLESQVQTDPLTGLFNFRYFAKSLENEMERTRRSGQPTSLIMIDLDHFKQVNDTRGHEVGNLVLKQTAGQIVSHMRKLDMACRYGGEEFVVILPNTKLERAVEAAERLRRLREEEPVELSGNEQFHVTASLGVTVFTGGEFLTRQEFVAHADRYLYLAKDAGRNRIMAPKLKKPADTEVTVDEKRALLG